MPFPLLLVPFVMGAAAGGVVSYLYLKDPLQLFSVEEDSSAEENPETDTPQASAENTSSGNSSPNNTMS